MKRLFESHSRYHICAENRVARHPSVQLLIPLKFTCRDTYCARQFISGPHIVGLYIRCSCTSETHFTIGPSCEARRATSRFQRIILSTLGTCPAEDDWRLQNCCVSSMSSRSGTIGSRCRLQVKLPAPRVVGWLGDCYGSWNGGGVTSVNYGAGVRRCDGKRALVLLGSDSGDNYRSNFLF